MNQLIRKFNQAQSFSLALILLLVVSQSLAADKACKMTDNVSSASLEVETSNPHAGHNMPSIKMDSDIQIDRADCCQSECQCVQNSCTNSTSMISNSLLPEFSTLKSGLYGNENQLIFFQASTALFRPPIIC